MRYLISLSIAFNLIFSVAKSQPAVLPQNLTFDQAISISLQNNPEQRIKELNYQISLEQLAESKLARVPQVFGKYDVQRNLVIPSTLVPLYLFNPAGTPGELTPVKFGTNWYSNLGLYGSLKLFDPAISGEIKEKKISLELSDVERQIKKIDLSAETGRAYVACVLSSEQLKFAVDDTINARIQFEETRSKYNEGVLKITDFNGSRLNLNNSLSRYAEAEKIYNDTWKTLLFWMGFSQDERHNVVLVDSLNLLIIKFSNTASEKVDYLSSLTYKRQIVQTSLSRLRLKNTRAGFMPVISLNGFYAGDYFDNKFRITDSRFWYGNSNVNLSLRVPLTEGIGRVKKISQYKYQIESDEASLALAVNQKQLDIQKSVTDLEFFRKEALTKEENLSLTKANYLAAFSLFHQGRLLPSELSQADLSYKQTKVDYLKAIYNFLNTALEFKKIKES